MKCGNRVILCALATLALTVGSEGGSGSSPYASSFSESPVSYYYYPVPRGKQFRDTQARQPARLAYETRRGHEQHLARQYHQHPYHQHQHQQHTADHHPNLLHRHQAGPLPPHPTAAIVKLFIAPALDQAAFRKALISQGYAAHSASHPFPMTLDTRSLNVKLPLPIGLTPLRNAPLPLQEGASFASLPRDVTSYGTKHPLRRRR